MLKKNCKFLSLILLAGIIIGSIPPIIGRADVNNVELKDEIISIEDIEGTEYDLKQSKDVLNHEFLDDMKELIDSKYEIIKNNDTEIKYDNLTEGIGKIVQNKRDDFARKWVDLNNFSLDSYESELEIKSYVKIDENKYLVNCEYDMDAILTENSSMISSVRDEKYSFLIETETENKVMPRIIAVNESDDLVQGLFNTNENFKNELVLTEKMIIEDLKTEKIEIDNKINNAIGISNEYQQATKNLTEEEFKMVNPKARYNPTVAVEYARKYAFNYNTSYTAYEQDCTNFMSQALKSGGHTTTSSWKPGSIDWIRCSALNSFLWYKTDRGYMEYNDTKIRKGDLIFWRNKYYDRWNHTGMITGYNSNGLLFTAHTTNRRDYPVGWIAIGGGSQFDARGYVKLRY